MVKKISSLQIFAIVLICSDSIATQTKNTLVLTPDKVSQIVVQQTKSAREIDYKYQQYFLAPVQAQSNYDWKLSVEAGSELDRSENLQTSFSSPNTQYFYDRYKLVTTLSKQVATTGTFLSFDVERASQKTETITSGSTSRYPALTMDTLGLNIEQPLLANFFGYSDKSTLAASELNFKSNYLMRQDDLQKLVLKAVTLYWATYVSEQKFKQDTSSRENYKRLVQSVEKKKSLGYTSSGELEQVKAELETREQNVKLSSNEYLQNLEALLTLLDIPKDTEIKFTEMTNVSAPPVMKDISVEQLRPLKSQKLKSLAAQESYNASQWKNYPTLNVVGKLYDASVDEDASISQTAALSGKNPKYYVGIKFQYNFGSQSNSEDEINKKAALDLEKSILERQRLEMSDKYEQLKRKVSTNYMLSLSKMQQKNFRDKAVKELTKSFQQGRTDISILIDAMNKYYATETEYTKVVGDYYTSIYELTALRDELVTQTNENREAIQ